MSNNDNSQQMMVLYNHEIRMRDGVILRGDLYRPAQEGKYPVILMRAIFRKKTLSKSWGLYDPSFYVKNGYAVYIQDVRGLGNSDGDFVRFLADKNDGYDTIECLAAESWCSGNVGMFGNYYAAFLQFQAAASKPPHLKAICPCCTHVSLNRNNDTWGFPIFYAHIGWCMAREVSRMVEGHYPQSVVDEYMPKMQQYLKDYWNILATTPTDELPMQELRKTFSIIDEFFKVALPGYDNIEEIKREGRMMDLSELEVPALLISGWQESTRNTMIDHCDSLRRTARDNARQSEVIIGPWKAGEPMSQAENALHIPETYFRVEEEILRWFDKWLKENPVQEKKPYRIYDPSIQAFVEFNEWKDEGEKDLTFYLESNGSANTRFGDGRLQADPPKATEGYDSYIYNPQNPISSKSYGDNCQAQEERSDILVYTSEHLEAEVDVCGVIKIELYASSSALDTDFIVYILDVTPTEEAILVGDGAVRAKYRESLTPIMLEPGKPYLFEILVSNVVYRFKKGHNIRLEVKSSDYGKFERNRNTGKRPEEDNEFIIAKNSVFHNELMPSKIIMPLR